MNRLPFGIGDFIATIKSFNPDQPRDDHGKWTGGSGGFRNIENEGEGRTGRYAGLYSAGKNQLTSSTRQVFDSILDNQDDIALNAPINRQSKFFVKSKKTGKSASVEVGQKKIFVNISKPRTEGLGNIFDKSKKFDMADWNDQKAADEAGNFVKEELGRE